MDRAPNRPLAALTAASLALTLVVVLTSAAIRLGTVPPAQLAESAVLVVRGAQRVAASLAALLVLLLAWRARRSSISQGAYGAAGIVLALSLLGVLAGTSPPPLAALGNLLGGLTLAAVLAWLLGREEGRPARPARTRGIAVAILFLAVQCVVGARLAIFAQELWSWPLLLHALLGTALASGAAWLALRTENAARRFALLGLALAVPAAGAASALFELPLAATLAHAGASALLVSALAYAHASLA